MQAIFYRLAKIISEAYVGERNEKPRISWKETGARLAEFFRQRETSKEKYRRISLHFQSHLKISGYPQCAQNDANRFAVRVDGMSKNGLRTRLKGIWRRKLVIDPSASGMILKKRSRCTVSCCWCVSG